MKQFMGSRKQIRDMVGGHIMQTLLWDTAKFVEKRYGVWQWDIVKNINQQQRWETVKNHELSCCCWDEGLEVVEYS